MKLLGLLDDKRLLPATAIDQEIRASGRLRILLCNIHDGLVQMPCGIERMVSQKLKCQVVRSARFAGDGAGAPCRCCVLCGLLPPT